MKALLIAIVVAALSCNNTKKNKADTQNDGVSNKKDTINNNTTNKSMFKDGGTNDSTILISFPKDSTWVTVNGKMKGINNPVSVYIPVKHGRRLTAMISPEDPTANIRINQIFTPDGKADGPFGRELKRSLHQRGIYKLIISENMMQGDEWKGNFKLTIKVE